jgi:hypothetical protein
MRPLGLLALITVLAVGVAGCGSSSTPTPTETVRVTTAAQVAAMAKRLEEGEKRRPIYAAEREECEAVTSEYEWLKLCIEPQTEKLARLVVHDEALANELMHKAGEGCREALRDGPVYDRIDKKSIEGCKEDIGKQPEQQGGEESRATMGRAGLEPATKGL